MLALVFFVAPLISLLRGPTLDYLLDRQAWAWLYAVNIYIAKNGEWSFSILTISGRSPSRSISISSGPWSSLCWLAGPRAYRCDLAIALCAMLGRLTGSLMGLPWWTTYTLPFPSGWPGARRSSSR